MGHPATLTIQKLSYSYGGIRALDEVDLEVASGKICSVLGPNGAGKTTLGACIAGALGTPRGTVALDHEDVTAHGVCGRAKLGVVYVPEGGSVFPTLTVEENLVVGRVPGLRDSEILEQATSYFGFLGERRKQRAGLLSGGEQRMLALARILVTRPRLAVIDELSHGLAPIIVDRLFEVLDSARGMTTFVLIEQYLQRAYGLADHLLVLSTGRSLYSGEASGVTVSEVEAMYSLQTTTQQEHEI